MKKMYEVELVNVNEKNEIITSNSWSNESYKCDTYDEALKEKGKEYFEELDANNLALIAEYGHEIKYDGLLLSIDDMYDLYLSKNYEDICYTSVEDL